MPSYMKETFSKFGMDKESPAMFDMVCWITNEHDKKGMDGLTFDEFMDFSIAFFNQRESE